MFCRNKNKKKKIEIACEPRTVKSRVESEYVEIKEAATEFYRLGQLARDINDIDRELKSSNPSLFFYQKSVMQEFIREFEHSFEVLFGKKTSFNEYWKTRSC